MRLAMVPVESSSEFITLLAVRNECRDGLFHTTQELTLADQAKFADHCWLEPEAGPSFEPYLFWEGQWPVGFGLLKWDGEKLWMTAGLTRQYRGMRLSPVIIEMITQVGYANHPGAEIWITVTDNNPALRGDIRAGYEFIDWRWDSVGKNRRILHTMKHNRNRRLREQEAERLGQQSEDIRREIEEVDSISREVYGYPD